MSALEAEIGIPRPAGPPGGDARELNEGDGRLRLQGFYGAVLFCRHQCEQHLQGRHEGTRARSRRSRYAEKSGGF